MMEHFKKINPLKTLPDLTIRSKTNESHTIYFLKFSLSLNISTRAGRCLAVTRTMFSIFVILDETEVSGQSQCSAVHIKVKYMYTHGLKLSCWNFVASVLFMFGDEKGKSLKSLTIWVNAYFICPPAPVPYCTIAFTLEDIGEFVWILWIPDLQQLSTLSLQGQTCIFCIT